MSKWKPVIIVPALILFLGGCSFLSANERATMSRISSEIGGKAVLEWNDERRRKDALFEMRRRAAEKLIEVCLSKSTPIGTSLDCVRAALRLVQ